MPRSKRSPDDDGASGDWDKQMSDPWAKEGGGGFSDTSGQPAGSGRGGGGGGDVDVSGVFDKPYGTVDRLTDSTDDGGGGSGAGSGGGDFVEDTRDSAASSLDDGAGNIDEGQDADDGGDGSSNSSSGGGGGVAGGMLDPEQRERLQREAEVRARIKALMNNPMACVLLGGAAFVQGGIVGGGVGAVLGVVQGMQMKLQSTQLRAFARGQAMSNAKTFGGFLAIYEGSKCAIVQVRKKDDIFNSGFAGFTTGFVTSMFRRQPPATAVLSGLTFGLGIMALHSIS